MHSRHLLDYCRKGVVWFIWMLLWFVVVSLILSSTSLNTFEYDDPLACIVSNSPCEWERTCENLAYRSKHLSSPIPRQYHDIDRISCCFKCLRHHFEPKTSLSTNSTLRSEFSAIKKLDDPRGSEIALMSKSLILRSSHHIILSPIIEFGVPFQYTITSICSSHARSWKNILGRSLILINTNLKCTSKGTTQSTLQQIEYASNPLVRIYYTYNLPCQMSMQHEAWHDKIHLIPVGIRSPIAISTFKKTTKKTILLDCSCAKASPRWILLKGLVSTMPCSFGPDVSVGIDTFESEEEVRDIADAYRYMNSAKYVLSPSYPEEMSHCEWEALALGAIPILQQNLIADPRVRNLFEGLPIFFADFPSISKEILEQQYDSLLVEYSDPSKYSLSKLYFPYWLHRFTKTFVTGKPPQRVWENIGNLIAHRKNQIKDCAALDRRDPQSFSRFGRIGQNIRVLHKQKDYPRANKYNRKQNLQLEFVLPRCCEDGEVEFAWVQELLGVTSEDTGVAIYYKCPQCLPFSKSKDWLNSASTPFIEDDFTGLHGVTLIDDTSLLSVGGDRLYQKTCIDRIHNGKEVTAYLTHIIDNYDHLAEQTVFLHSVPHSHLHFELFYRLVAFSERCRNITSPIDFLHLNVHYKTQPHLWTSCCGCKPWGPGSCRVGTWKYLFHDYPEMGPDYQHAHTYSSAQFVVSKRTLLHWPKSFYERMLVAINGTHEIVGCCHSSSDDRWGGHSLTGQYERMWHIIFGHARIQQERRSDFSIPSYLRLDCSGDARCSLGAL